MIFVPTGDMETLEKRITGYQNMFQDIFKDVYGLESCDLQEYFDKVQIQQSPNYAYGEDIAIISEKTKDNFRFQKVMKSLPNG